MVRYLSFHKTEGTVLTQEFVDSYVLKDVYKNLIATSYGALLFEGPGLFISFDQSQARSNAIGWIGSIIWISVAIPVTAIPVYHNTPATL